MIALSPADDGNIPHDARLQGHGDKLVAHPVEDQRQGQQGDALLHGHHLETEARHQAFIGNAGGKALLAAHLNKGVVQGGRFTEGQNGLPSQLTDMYAGHLGKGMLPAHHKLTHIADQKVAFKAGRLLHREHDQSQIRLSQSHRGGGELGALLHQADVNAGVLPVKAGKQLGKIHVQQHPGNTQPYLSGLDRAHVRHGLEDRLILHEKLLGPLVQDPSRIGQVKALAGAFNEQNIQRFLQLLDGTGQHGLCHKKLGGCAGKALLPDHFNKIFQVLNIHSYLHVLGDAVPIIIE